MVLPIDLKGSFEIFRRRISCGLETIVVPIKKVPIVTIDVGYKAGSKDEIRGMTGFAHLFEHLMFEGTKNVDRGGFDRLCSLAGGTNNAYTTYDYTLYTMTLPSHQSDLGLWLESDRMLNFRIIENALENQQKVVSEEIRQTVENQPYGRWRELLAEAAFSADCSYSWEVHGRIADVINCTMENAEDFFRRYYNPYNARLVVCGDVSPEETFEKAEKYFDGKTEEMPIRRNAFSKEYRQSPAHVFFEDHVPYPAVFISFHCPGFPDDVAYTSDILAAILGEGRSSRLYSHLVNEKQIASSAGAFMDKREHTSLLTIYAFANSEDVSADALADEIHNVLNVFAAAPLKKNDLEKVRNKLATQIAQELQSSSGLADIITQLAMFWNDPGRIYTLPERYMQVGGNNIREFFERYINIDNSVRIDTLPASQ